jgi:opacity protein-like surface antigen
MRPCSAAFYFALALTAFPALPLGAQGADREWSYKLELFGDVAYSALYNGDHKWGSGLSPGLGVGVRPFAGALRGVGFEARMAHMGEDKGSPDTLATKLSSTMVGANVVYHFRGRTAFQPYVFGGLGVAMVKYSSICGICVYTAPPAEGGTPILQKSEIRTAEAGLDLGCGVKIAITRRLSVRPEISYLDTTPGAGWNIGWLRVQTGVGFHF